jgi:molybdate transport system ATP-binding protein
VALARALVSEPDALLLDEPFAALDPALRVRMRAELDSLQRRLAIPMLLITHDPDDAATFGGHVLTMADGRVAGEEHGG